MADEDADARRTDDARVENEWDADGYDEQLSVVYELADDLVDLLAPEPGERIADVGCGTGHLTAEIASRGAEAVGVDRSRTMVERARESFPDVPFHRADVRALPFHRSMDAVFSNAALHWVDDQDAALASIHDALRPGGRLVAELGGTGNVAAIRDAVGSAIRRALARSTREDAVRGELEARGYDEPSPWYFPSPGEYASRLEEHGFEVRLVRLFDRPTPLDGGEDGLATWLDAFGDAAFAPLSAEEERAVVDDVEDRLRGELFDGEQWVADYRRLRVVAVRR